MAIKTLLRRLVVVWRYAQNSLHAVKLHLLKLFGQGEGGSLRRGFVVVDTVGGVIDAPETYKDVKGQVTADYQKYVEDKWVKSLRKKYKVKIDKDVLKTVNNHD